VKREREREKEREESADKQVNKYMINRGDIMIYTKTRNRKWKTRTKGVFAKRRGVEWEMIGWP
jgi:hypothetical protein